MASKMANPTINLTPMQRRRNLLYMCKNKGVQGENKAKKFVDISSCAPFIFFFLCLLWPSQNRCEKFLGLRRIRLASTNPPTQLDCGTRRAGGGLGSVNNLIRKENRSIPCAGGGKETGENSVGFGPVMSFVAASDFPTDHGRSQHPLALIVCGLCFIVMEKPKKMGSLFSQSFCKTSIFFI